MSYARNRFRRQKRHRPIERFPRRKQTLMQLLEDDWHVVKLANRTKALTEEQGRQRKAISEDPLIRRSRQSRLGTPLYNRVGFDVAGFRNVASAAASRA